MTTGFLSAFVAMAVWSRGLAQSSEPIHSFVETFDSGLTTFWDSVIVPFDGTYIVSITVDPLLWHTTYVEQIEAKLNGELIFTAYAQSIMSNTAMALFLNMNDQITAEGAQIDANEANRLSVAFVSATAPVYAAKVSHAIRILDGLPTPFNKAWNHPGFGWTDHQSNFIEVAQRGVYWVMARLNAMMRTDVQLAVTFHHPVAGHLYDVMTLTTYVSDPISCSGAFLMFPGERAMLMARDGSAFFNHETILCAVYLDSNQDKAFTARPVTRPDCAGVSDFYRWTEFPQGPIYGDGADRDVHSLNHYKRHAVAAAAGRTGHNATSSGHRTKRIPPYDVDKLVLFWGGEIITNYGNMVTAENKRLRIPVSGVYVVGMRPENTRLARYHHMGFLLYLNQRAIWATWSEVAGSGETFGWRFHANDYLILRIFGSCNLGVRSLFSVALLTQE